MVTDFGNRCLKLSILGTIHLEIYQIKLTTDRFSALYNLW